MKFSGKLVGLDEMKSKNGKVFWLAKFDNNTKFSVWSETIAEELKQSIGKDINFTYKTKGAYNNIIALGGDEPNEQYDWADKVLKNEVSFETTLQDRINFGMCFNNASVLLAPEWHKDRNVNEVLDLAEKLLIEGKKRCRF